MDHKPNWKRFLVKKDHMKSQQIESKNSIVLTVDQDSSRKSMGVDPSH